jgi:hypothetical protein
VAKTKLTLYVEKDISEKAKKLSEISGKSISNIVSDYIYSQDLERNDFKISDKIKKWIGVAETEVKDHYKVLRDKIYDEKLKKYESTS